MKVGEEFKGCRYWGYDVASATNSKKAREDRKIVRQKFPKAAEYGFVSSTAARIEATKIERETGVEMWVFDHDYL